MKIAFLILAHACIELVSRQIQALHHPEHHFFVHLDKRYNPDIKDEFLRDRSVHFTDNRIRVNWGGFSIVQASLGLINKALSSKTAFDYFVLMSGQCYPIKPIGYIREFLASSQGQSFMEIRPLPDAGLKNGGLEKFQYPVFFDHLGFVSRDAFVLKNKIYEPKKAVFRLLTALLKKMGYQRKIPEALRPCFGSQWWVLHRSAVKYVANYVVQNPEVCNFFKYTWAPDELFFQSILSSSYLGKTIEPRSLWYIDWSANGPPKTLGVEDIDKLLKSDALFARKIKDISMLTEISGKILYGNSIRKTQ